ncbi:MAG: DUF1592 domain-containing protein [Verrucomicrobiaceae bacterium]|nr:DUF1592 domain-containing protein [Verrucomicrobiaceae bacterium]
MRKGSIFIALNAFAIEGRLNRQLSRCLSALSALCGTLPWLLAMPVDCPAKDLSYQKEVLPILEQYCFDCHGDGTEKGGLSLDSWKSPAERVADLHVWKEVLRNVSLKVMPPPKRKVQPSEAERAVIEGWIEQRVFRYDPDNPDPGRVTIRRLNRQEYNNTVRDLLHVNFKPGEDFPPDDTGYGFDTIGDVLTLSPVLLEKYMSAAGRVMDAAMRTTAPQGKKQQYPAQSLKGGQMHSGSRILSTIGSVSLKHHFPQDGEYIIRIRAAAHQAGDEAAKMTINVNGRDLHTFEVGNEPEELKNFERRVRMKAGSHEVTIKFINDYYNPKERDRRRRDRNLLVDGLEVEKTGAVVLPLPEFHRRILGSEKITPANRLAVAKKVLHEFLCRAYRRRVPQAEVERLMRFVKMGFDEGGPFAFEKGIKLACQAVLVSPFFLYRGEVQKNPDDPETVSRIDDYALASRLSYFIWSSMPDDELFLQAGRGDLRKNLNAQVIRMLKDPKARALTENFAGQWLQLRNMDLVSPDPGQYREFDDKLRRLMRMETEALFEHVMRNDLPITEFLDADYSFINARLARHYGIKGVSGDALQKVSLAGSHRRGILTHGSILTITSNPTRTSPVKRGKWILDNILGTPPPDPPPGVGQLEDNSKLEGTFRQRLEQHRKDPNCAACHALMDPLGIAFENFDGVGRWRDDEGGQRIDSSGELVSGERFETHEQFQEVLSTSKRGDYLRCVSEMMLTFALGRGLEFYDKPAVSSVVKRLQDGKLSFSRAVLGVVDSVPFQYRRGDGRRIYD